MLAAKYSLNVATACTGKSGTLSAMETARLYLRLRTKQIQEDLMHLTTQEQLSFLGLASVEELTSEIIRSQKRFGNLEMKSLKWELIEKNDQKVIGSCGFHNWYEEHNRAEIGYALNHRYQGKGFMMEGLTRVIDYGFHEMKLNRIEAFISPSNLKSISVINALGFTKEGVLREHYKNKDKIDDSLVYSLLKSDRKR